jgi:hypothetical protein
MVAMAFIPVVGDVGEIAAVAGVKAFIRKTIATLMEKLAAKGVSSIGERAALDVTENLGRKAALNLALGVGKQAAMGSALSTASDLGAQGIQIAEGHRDGLDVGSLRDSAISGAVAGPVAGALGGPATAAASHGLSSVVGHEFAGGVGGRLISSTIGNVPGNIVGNIAGQAATNHGQVDFGSVVEGAGGGMSPKDHHASTFPTIDHTDTTEHAESATRTGESDTHAQSMPVPEAAHSNSLDAETISETTHAAGTDIAPVSTATAEAQEPTAPSPAAHDNNHVDPPVSQPGSAVTDLPDNTRPTTPDLSAAPSPSVAAPKTTPDRPTPVESARPSAELPPRQDRLGNEPDHPRARPQPVAPQAAAPLRDLPSTGQPQPPAAARPDHLAAAPQESDPRSARPEPGYRADRDAPDFATQPEGPADSRLRNTVSHPELGPLSDAEIELIRRNRGHRFNEMVNKAGSDGHRALPDSDDVEIRALITAYDKLPDYRGTVYRSLHIDDPVELGEFLEDYQQGHALVDAGFVSAHKQSSMAGGNVEVVIESHHGKDVSWAGHGQDEIVFPPGTRFGVESVAQNGSKFYIHLHEMGRRPDAAQPVGVGRHARQELRHAEATRRAGEDPGVHPGTDADQHVDQHGPVGPPPPDAPSPEPEGSDPAETVADQMERLIGVPATWGNWAEKFREFEEWMRSPIERELPPLRTESVLNCWEMVLYAAAKTGVLSHAQLHEIYTFDKTPEGIPPEHWFNSLPDQLSPGGCREFTLGDPESPLPQRGDIVYFNGATHVAMATGRLAPDGSPETYSFWPPPYEHGPDKEGRWRRVDAVKEVSIERLHNYMTTSAYREELLVGGRAVVTFGRGPW